ncbi:MAG: hypothetical protein Q9216_006296 [Gyalolechia sp. 2 TL-2023]
MSSPRRQSPRAAIRNWLAHTDSRSTARRKGTTEHQLKERERHVKRQRPPHLSHGESRRHKPQPQAENKRQRSEEPPRHRAQSKSRRCQHHICRFCALNQKAEDHPNDANNDRTLADQLGLHAPFLSLATRGTDIAPEVERDRERRKRRRSLSTASSCLEPATCFSNDDRGPGIQRKIEADTDRRRTQHDNVATSPRSSSVVALSQKPAKSYERRPRRKTREDHYELKKGKKQNKPKDGEKASNHKAKKRRHRTEKSGAVLMHNFSANNVGTERLTVIPRLLRVLETCWTSIAHCQCSSRVELHWDYSAKGVRHHP